MRRRSLFLLLSPLVGLGVMGWIAIQAGLSLRSITSQVEWETHLLVLGAWSLSLLGRGGRIALLARGLGRSLSLTRAMAVQLLGEGAAAVTPSRAGSDPARLLYLRKVGIDVPTGIAVLIGEMVAEGIVLGGVILTLLLLLPTGRGPVLGALPYSLAALAMPFLATLLARLPASRIPPRLVGPLGMKGERWRRVRIGVRRFRLKARALTRLERKTMMAVLLVSLVHVLARLSILPLLAGGFGGSVPLAPLLAWPLLLLYTGSLLPPPGGGGAVELTFAAVLTPFLGQGALASALLWWRFYTFYLGALLGGVVLLLALGRVGLNSAPPERGPHGMVAAPLPAPEPAALHVRPGREKPALEGYLGAPESPPPARYPG